MNQVIKSILSRQSVRGGFARTPLPVQVLEEIVLCGLAAPSSKNGRPWRFHVVTTRSLLEELAGFIENAEEINAYVPSDLITGRPRPELRSSVLESAAVLRTVPAAIFIEDTGGFTGGRKALLSASPEALRRAVVGYTFNAIGIGAAVENMWVAAVAHRLSGVFLGDVLIAESEISNRLEIDRDLVGALALGYQEESSRREIRGDNLRIDPDRIRWIAHP